MKKLLLIILFLPLSLVAQEKINGKQFAQKIWQGHEIHYNKLAFSEGIPLVEKYEFRSESHDFDFDKQEYLFRISPSNPHKRKVQKEVLQHMQKEPIWSKIKYTCNILEEAHRDWLKLYELNQSLMIENKKKELLSDKEEIHNIRTSNFDIDLEQSIKLTSSLTKNRISREKLKNHIQSLKTRNDLTTQTLDFSSFIQMDELILSLDNAVNLSNPDRMELDYDSIAIQNEIRLEKADKKQFFDFFQIRYQGPQIDPLAERVSLGVGIIFQNSGDKKLDLVELELEKEKNRFNKQLEILKQEQEEQLIIEEIKKNYRDFINLRSNIEKEHQQYEALKAKIISRSDYKPELIFEMRDRMLENKEKLLEAEIEIYDLYLDYLDITGQFCQNASHFFLEK